ncbi:P1 family peptidase [Gordonia rubripertincta]|uniref:P1 family peptidase n=1 Tax=Gordonia rubripertincta TaxID=36822 RepID=A0AAW4GAS1_GORRU|nr:P1 family peptidase [Gordonia rubripertincta]MBM7280225.1 P1 family peptidase [Gordonia rubripertincta]
MTTIGRPARPGDRITDVAGITVGHRHRVDADAEVAGTAGAPDGHGWATGTTVVRISGPGAIAAVDVRGGGPGTRETDLLDPSNTVQTAHAIVLSGGSAYGLATADGAMRALEAEGVGLPMDTRGHVVPIVPAAVIFDLPVGAWDHRPDADFGAEAVRAAAVDFAVGSVGAGAGARAGALKGGVGTASVRIETGPAAGITVGALMIANPVGAVIDPKTGLPWDLGEDELAELGLRRPEAADIAHLAELAEKHTVLNTTIGVVATDAALDAAMTRRIAMAGHDGLGRAIRPAHSPLDGDTIFAVATGAVRSESTDPAFASPPGMHADTAIIAEVSRCAADVVQRAIVDAVLAAESVASIPTYAEAAPSAFA